MVDTDSNSNSNSNSSSSTNSSTGGFQINVPKIDAATLNGYLKIFESKKTEIDIIVQSDPDFTVNINLDQMTVAGMIKNGKF